MSMTGQSSRLSNSINALSGSVNDNCLNQVRLYKNNKKLTTRYYTAEYVSDRNGSLVFTCLTNYHPVEGHLEMYCENNIFVGEELRCEVDYYIEKVRLSTMIALITFVIPAAWLLFDFYMFTQNRRKMRLITYKPIQGRTRVQLTGVTIEQTEILRDIMNYINKGNAEFRRTQMHDFSNGVDKLTDDFEDIFANKTKIKQTPSNQREKESQFELMGTARVFGKIGKILTKDLF
ncbi:hypothetical protein EGW08_020058 [Elysia chlorotica]|uniref:Uncharacterized protein n=1 Tax=Elysia chlorotica TaxID=188477 RepID=A0A3S0ZD49_ELYCH|nr:hypothetical protein EGW08_020058 [Elysia chlorotica]